MFVDKELKRFGGTVVKEAKTALTKQDRNVTRQTYNSIRFDSKVSKNSFELSFYMSDSGQYLDKGVQGKISTLKSPDSPFRFGSGTGKTGGLTKGILEWVKKRRFQFTVKPIEDKKGVIVNKSKVGQLMSYSDTARLITRSIYLKGTKPTNFFTKPFNAAFKRLPNEIVKAYGLEVDQLLKNALI